MQFYYAHIYEHFFKFGLGLLLMAALWNRAGHYVFALWFLSFFFLFPFYGATQLC